MSCCERNGQAARFQLRLQNPQGCDGDGQDRGLGMLGALELVLRTFEDDLRERKAEGVIGLFEDRASCGKSIVQCTAHADGLRTLAGKEEGDLVRSAHLDSLAGQSV